MNHSLRSEPYISKKISLKNLYKLVYNKVYCNDNIESLENEEWREIAETKGNYYASNYGRIKSYCGYNAIILKATTTTRGYARVPIVINGISYNKFIHRLVASCFLEQPKSKMLKYFLMNQSEKIKMIMLLHYKKF